MVELPQYDVAEPVTPVELVAPVVPVAIVAPVPVAPVVPQPPVVYDVEDDPEIEITYSHIRPRHQIPSDYRERARNIKRERR